MAVVKKIGSQLKYLTIYLISFIINYLIFIFFMSLVRNNNAVAINIINVFAWILSMLFIFFVDKMFVPDLLDENNSKELFKFFLIRVLSLILESLIIYIFIIILRNNYYLVKLISLIFLFILNEFYVKRIQFK